MSVHKEQQHRNTPIFNHIYWKRRSKYYYSLF